MTPPTERTGGGQRPAFDASSETLDRTPDIALVTMPFAPLAQPSLALGLLQASVQPGRTEVFYENLRFADAIGFERYEGICGRIFPSTHLVGEWLFCEAAFGQDRARDDAYIAEFLSTDGGSTSDDGSVDEFRSSVVECRGLVDAFLDEALERVLRSDPRIVGFTSVFQQHVASIALARRIKARRPDTVIVFGGANCEGPMGRALVRNYSYVDLVVSGDGEVAFAEIVDRVSAGRQLTGLAGVATRRDVPMLDAGAAVRAPAVDLDELPAPDFTEFFDQWGEVDVPPTWQPNLLFESARGCWWGAVRHCTFCGLNGEGMAFRSKSPERAVAELCELSARHPGLAIYAVDNIMDRDYFETFLPQLAASPFDARLFYEVKANLTKQQLRRLAAAGIRDIQPGIESLHDALLRLMAKGVTAIENVQLLKWCAELDIRPYWNLLWGFPGEPVEAFDQMTDLLPRLAHLRPPDGTGAIRLDRFSPNFERSDEMGFRDVRPVPAYRFVYDLEDDQLADLAYFFEFDDRELRDAAASIGGLQDAVATWRACHAESDLWMTDDGAVLTIWDTRGGTPPTDRHLTGLTREIYLACDGCVSSRALSVTLSASRGRAIGPPEVVEAIRPLVDDGLMMTDGRRFLALARGLGDRPVSRRFLEQFALQL